MPKTGGLRDGGSAERAPGVLIHEAIKGGGMSRVEPVGETVKGRSPEEAKRSAIVQSRAAPQGSLTTSSVYIVVLRP